jgi:hypothetical protein
MEFARVSALAEMASGVAHELRALQLSVCARVSISVSSSSVPNPPGKTTNARARCANQSFRMKK